MVDARTELTEPALRENRAGATKEAGRPARFGSHYSRYGTWHDLLEHEEKGPQTISFSDFSGSALTTLRAGLAL